MASIYDLYIEQGSDFEQEIDMAGDWDGYTIEISVEDAALNKTSGYASWSSAIDGKFKIIIPNSSTSSMTKGIGRYNVEITSQFGIKDRVIYGRIYIDGDV
jgi:hypothetical protein